MNDIRRRVATARRLVGADRLLTGISVVLLALLLVQGVRCLLVGRHERSLLQSLTQRNTTAPERGKPKPAQEYDEAIMGHGMLGPGQMPIRLWGVISDGALFGTSGDDAQFTKVGETLSSGEKVIEVRANEVVLEKDGKRRTEVVFEELRSVPQPMSAPGASPKREGKPPARTQGGPGPKPVQ